MSPANPNAPGLDYVPYFEELIRIQQHAIVSFKKWAGAFIFVGAGIILTSLMLRSRIEGFLSPMIGLGSLFIGASVAFPYREIAPRLSRVETYLLLKRSFEKLAQLSDEDQKRLRDLADETIRRSM